MIEILMDVESTGISPYNDEIIEAFFYIDESNSFYLKARPDNWSYEAQDIHKIPEHVAMAYPEKKVAYRELLKWLPQDFKFVTYANKNTELGHINYDYAILVNELNLLGTPNYYLENKYNMKPAESIHCLAKKCASNGSFKPLTSGQAYSVGILTDIKYKGSNRRTLRQEAVYYALFGERYAAHSCVEDVKALCRIKTELVRLSNEDRDMFKFN